MLISFFFFLELLDNLRPVSPKVSHERVKTPLGVTNTVTEKEEQPFKERFLKINVRHITDGQVRFMFQVIKFPIFFKCLHVKLLFYMLFSIHRVLLAECC